MTHLKIQQNNIPETVTTALLDKLYGIVSANDYVYHSDDLQGTLQVDKAYEDTIAYLQQKYPDLHITATTQYIRFADPEVQRVMTNWWGDGIGCTVADMQSHSSLNFSENDSTYGHYPFYGNTGIRTFNELGRFTNITSIGGFTFRECTNLTSVDLSNITYMGQGAFVNCSSLTSINLPSYVQGNTRGNTMYFSDCSNVTSITFGPNYQGLKDNDSQMFSGCSNLTEIVGMPTLSLTFIPYGCFAGCKKLVSIGNWQTISIDAYRENAFNGCEKLELTVDLTPCTWLKPKAFYHCYKMNFIGTLSTGLTDTQYCFNGCDLSNCTIEPVTISIRANTFENAKLPSTITLGDTFTNFGANSFQNTTGITTISCTSSNVDYIGQSAFLNSSVTTIGNGTFAITDLKGSTFKDSNITGKLSFPNLTTISDAYGRTFENCKNLQVVEFGHVSTFGWGYSGGNLTRGVFSNCTSLKIVNLGDSVQTMYDGQFDGCTSLKAIVINTSTPPATLTNGNNPAGNYALMFGNNLVEVYVPDAAVSTYQSTGIFALKPDQIKPISQYNESTILASS